VAASLAPLAPRPALCLTPMLRVAWLGPSMPSKHMSQARRFVMSESETGKTIGQYGSEDGALNAAASILRTGGRRTALGLTLTYEDPDGVEHVLSDGEALLGRVQQRTA
jgi:hypothetical protein